MNIAYIRPKQKIPRSEKDEEWGKKCVMYYKGTCQPAIDRAEALKMYRLANGELDDNEYLYVTNPLNTTRVELQGYPAKLKNHDIISPNVNLLMGEKAKRFFTPIVLAKNSEYHTQQLEQEQKAVVKEAQKLFVNELIKEGLPLEKEQVNENLQEVANKIKSLPDTLSEEGQLALEYILDYTEGQRYLRKGFFDYICNAHTISYRDVYKNKFVYDIISPIHFYYLMPPHIDMFEDGEACKVQLFMSVNEVYDKFQDLGEEGGFTPELEEYLERYANGQSSGLRDDYYYATTDMIGLQKQLFKNVFGYLPEERYSHGVIVEHINWRSQVKIGRVTNIDIFGEKDVYEVSEDYKISGNETIEWEWVDEVWEGFCIGDLYYLGIRPVPIQRGEFNNPRKAKLLYNGRKTTSRHVIPQSIVKKGESYQKSVNIIKYRAEETLAKNLDKIVLFPMGLIPKKEGWNEEKLMYYVRAFSFLFFDDTRPNASQMINAIKDLNLSMTEHILRSYELVRMFKNEWDEVCGFNPQRKAEINTSAGKGTTQMALGQSATMSEELFLSYEEFERREYQCMIDCSRYTFNEGVQAHFTRLDGTRAFLNIHDPSTYVNSDFGIFVKNGSTELNKLEFLKAQIQPLVQNGLGGRGVSGLIDSNNFAEVHKIMDEMDAKAEQRFQQEQATQQSIQASKERIAKEASDFDYYDANLKSTTDIQVALIQEGMNIADSLRKAEESGNKDQVAVEQSNLEKNAIALIQNATKLKEIASKERIAKHKDETSLKNKVSGEK